MVGCIANSHDHAAPGTRLNIKKGLKNVRNTDSFFIASNFVCVSSPRQCGIVSRRKLGPDVRVEKKYCAVNDVRQGWVRLEEGLFREGRKLSPCERSGRESVRFTSVKPRRWTGNLGLTHRWRLTHAHAFIYLFVCLSHPPAKIHGIVISKQAQRGDSYLPVC